MENLKLINPIHLNVDVNLTLVEKYFKDIGIDKYVALRMGNLDDFRKLNLHMFLTLYFNLILDYNLFAPKIRQCFEWFDLSFTRRMSKCEYFIQMLFSKISIRNIIILKEFYLYTNFSFTYNNLLQLIY